MRAIGIPLLPLMWVAFFAAIFAAWVWMYQMARQAGLDVLCFVPSAKGISITQLGTVLPMWLGMTAAMMLPTMIPTLRSYADLIRSAGPDAGASELGWYGVIAGYLGVWAAAATGFAILQVLLAGAGAIDDLGAAGIGYLSAALLVLAGLWQFTRTKDACQDACLSPTLVFLSNWRPGPVGAFRMGAGIGAFCVGCCWALMSLAFVGGIMNLAFMGLATALMIVEKLPDIGRHVTRPVGVLLVVTGLGVAALPHVFYGG